MLIWIDKIKFVFLQLSDRKFCGKLTMEIDFKDGGVASMHTNIKEQIRIV